MTTKEQIKEILGKWNFPILQEDEEVLLFRYQMSYVQLIITEGKKYVAVTATLNGLLTAVDREEKAFCLNVCNDLNFNLLQVKLYVDSESDLIISSEFFHFTEGELERQLDTALMSLIIAKKRFFEVYNGVREEQLAAAELDNN